MLHLGTEKERVFLEIDINKQGSFLGQGGQSGLVCTKKKKKVILETGRI